MKNKNFDRLSQEAKQIDTLFQQFKKILAKCRDLCKILKTQLPNEALYSGIERTTPMKVRVLDLPGMVNLKNSLAKTTSELFDQERELVYKKEKQEAREKIERETAWRALNNKGERNNANRADRAANTASIRASQVGSEISQSRNIEIPIYKSKTEAAEGKMDRISKYIASLKKNIKTNAEQAGSKWRVKEYLLDQPDFVKAKAELQRYMMREEEVEKVIGQAVQTMLKQHFQNSPNITSDQQFYYVKVRKEKKKVVPPKSAGQRELRIRAQKPSAETASHPAPEKSNPETKQPSGVQEQAGNDFEQMKQQLQKKNYNYAELFSKMNEEVEKGSERLIEIRNKRKKAFQQDDDIWGEL